MRIPVVEALFPTPWTAAARRVLPSPSPQLTATAMWGPIFGWCALELLAESIDPRNPEQSALDLFDRLRLREPFAKAFDELGFGGEDGWRVAARIKVGLLLEAEVGKPEREADEEAVVPETPTAALGTATIDTSLPEKEVEAVGPSKAGEIEREEKKVGLAPALWSDPDVRWLTGVHEAKGHAYFIREPYEELLWWLMTPSLLRLAGEAAPSRTTAKEMSKTVHEALAEAAAAGYRVDVLTKQDESDGADREEAREEAEDTAPVGAPGKSEKRTVEEPESLPGIHYVKGRVKSGNS